MNTCVHCLLSLPVTEDGRKVFVEFVHNLWGQRRVGESTQYGIVGVIAKVEYTLSRACQSVRDPAAPSGGESGRVAWLSR